MTKWTQEHPITAHLINLLINLLLFAIAFFILDYVYGDIIHQIYKQTQIIFDIVTKS